MRAYEILTESSDYPSLVIANSYGDAEDKFYQGHDGPITSITVLEYIPSNIII